MTRTTPATEPFASGDAKPKNQTIEQLPVATSFSSEVVALKARLRRHVRRIERGLDLLELAEQTEVQR